MDTIEGRGHVTSIMNELKTKYWELEMEVHKDREVSLEQSADCQCHHCFPASSYQQQSASPQSFQQAESKIQFACYSANVPTGQYSVSSPDRRERNSPEQLAACPAVPEQSAPGTDAGEPLVVPHARPCQPPHSGMCRILEPEPKRQKGCMQVQCLLHLSRTQQDLPSRRLHQLSRGSC